MMTNIKIEGTEFKIVNPDSGAQIDALELGSLRQFLKTEDTRVAFFRSHFPPHEDLPYVLVWQEKVNLDGLDSRILEGDYDETDFVGAYRTSLRNLFCSECGASVSALVIDAGDPYPSNANLHREKIEKLKSQTCPQCSSSLRQLVVKCL